MGFFIAYVIDRCKEGRLRRKVAVVIKNEIDNCGESAKKEIENINKIDCFPAGIQHEKIYLGGLILSTEFYGTIYYESYMNHLYLFKDATQKEIGYFYTLIFRLNQELPGLRILVEDHKYPAEVVKDSFDKQKLLREKIIEKASVCKDILYKESKKIKRGSRVA